MKPNRTLQPTKAGAPIRRRLAILVACLLVPPLLAGGLLLAPPRPTTAQTPSTATSWRDTFDTWDNLYAQSNVDVVSGSLTLAPDNQWIQTTQADFESSELRGIDISAQPGSARLQHQTTFAPSTVLSPGAQNTYQETPAVAVDGKGVLYIVWKQNKTVGAGVYFATQNTDGQWSDAVEISAGREIWGGAHPRLAVSPDGSSVAVWNNQGGNEYGTYLAYRSIGGAWSASERIVDDGYAEFDVAMDEAGDTYILRTCSPTDLHLCLDHRSKSGTWYASERVTDAGSEYYPALAVDNTGTIYAAWTQVTGDNWDVYFAARSPSGVWSTPSKINDDVGLTGQSHPSIAVGPRHEIYLAWTDERNGDADIYFAYRSNTGTSLPYRKFELGVVMETQSP